MRKDGEGNKIYTKVYSNYSPQLRCRINMIVEPVYVAYGNPQLHGKATDTADLLRYLICKCFVEL